MASKQLTASLRLNTRDFENKIRRVAKSIDAINKATGRGSRAYNAVNNALRKTETQTRRVQTSTNQIQTIYNRMSGTLTTIRGRVQSWWSSQNQVKSSVKSTNALLSTTLSRLRSIAYTYLGIMGGRAVVNTSDLITGAENKLRYVASENLGDAAFTSTGEYSKAVFDSAQDSMDKMYASSQKVRMSYADMMTNVSKSMALAGESFQSTDNAIRFQEIMAEAYAVGGATAQEMSASMYQMIQALGGNLLAGDELRSVREGAPLAYKAIEEFAQGVYNTEESLKDLASQGKITADIVISAIMGAGDKMDAAFAQTTQTFAQTWDQIKNAAVYAFKPVSYMLSDMMNEAIDNGLIQKLEGLFTEVSKAFQIAVKVIGNGISWISDNWSWLQDVLTAGLYTIGILLGALLVKSIVLFVVNNAMLLIIAGAIFGVVYALMQWQQGMIDTATLAGICIGIIAAGIILIGVLTHSTALIVIGVVLLIIAWIASKSQNLCDFIYQLAMIVAQVIVAVLAVILAIYLATGAVMMSVPMMIVLAIIAVVALLVAAIAKYGEQICAFIFGAASVIWNIIITLITAIIQNAIMPLALAWDTFANFFGNLFNDPIAAIIHMFEGLANAVLGILKTIASGIDAIFGSNLAGAVQGWMDSVSGWADNAAEKYGNGSYEEKSNMVDQVNQLAEDAISAFTWDTSLAINQGAAFGAGIQDGINSFGEGLANGLDELTSGLGGGMSLDDLGGALGLNFSGMTGGFPSAGAVPDYTNTLDDISGDTGSMADSMELSQEDLEYLRRLADMEWKKEFTTANITVDMSNYNTINGESDLDGIVTKLTDRLYEEMNVVANGVYA